jgi:hypothetical protein
MRLVRFFFLNIYLQPSKPLFLGCSKAIDIHYSCYRMICGYLSLIIIDLFNRALNPQL